MWCGWASAAGINLRDVELGRSDDGVLLSFTAGFELPKTVEEALLKGVPLHFEAEAQIYRSRWYWRDQRVARAGRTWRLAYQPLTRRYRVTFGSLNQNYDTLDEALAAIQRTTRWRIADLSRFEPGERHYIELDFRLDTSQLPRPFQIGIGGEDEWDLSAESTLVMDDPN
nr:DUF4390 domain-containing protein [Caldimonas mangrovi]